MKKSIITYLIIASLSLIPAQTIHAGIREREAIINM